VKEIDPDTTTKSGVMAGLGETKDELVQAMKDLRAVGCDLLTVGQYLRPGDRQIPVERYYRPEEFDGLAETARGLGFRGVASGPFVRSSYFAETLLGETGLLPQGDKPHRRCGVSGTTCG
ncbi:MAG: hypothetical protein KKI02_03410, partial [Planctomycetes bacterium]|nr:hypothetical protein [Planctomycetota bacterium]